MNYLNIYRDCISDGPGVRVSLYVSGCRNHCPGCHNTESWDFAAGKEFTDTILQDILDFSDHEYIKGLTICGGEPFEEENQESVCLVCRAFKEKFPKKDIWIYTGYEFRDLIQGGKKYVSGITYEIMDLASVLIVGPFIQEQRDISDENRWRGSRNQRLILSKESMLKQKPVYLENIPNNE